MSNELSLVEQTDRLMPSVQTLESLKTQAKALVDAGMLPPGYNTASDALVVALKAREMGVLPMRGWQGMFPMKGRIGYMGTFLLGLLYERCPEAEIITVENNPERCILKVRRNKSDEHSIVTVTMEEAKASKWDVSWDKNAGAFKPKPTWNDKANMLYWRCVTRAFNRHFSHIVGGSTVYTKDEIEDIPEGDTYIPAAAQASASVPYETKKDTVPPAEAEVVQPALDENDKTLADLKDAFDACNTKAEVDALWNTVKTKHVSNGKMLNEGLKMKNARKAVVS
jgi:hypothetical protein